MAMEREREQARSAAVCLRENLEEAYGRDEYFRDNFFVSRCGVREGYGEGRVFPRQVVPRCGAREGYGGTSILETTCAEVRSSHRKHEEF